MGIIEAISRIHNSSNDLERKAFIEREFPELLSEDAQEKFVDVLAREINKL